MKQVLILGCCIGLSIGALAQSSARIQIKNSGPAAQTQRVVEIPWATVLAAYPKVDTTQLQIVLAGTEQAVPYQLERRGEKAVRNLLVQVTVGPKQTLQLTLRPGKAAPVQTKTFCRFVPERFDDFAWENDKTAFRIYGAALDGRRDNAYGTDIWAKRTDKMILDKWYKQNDYHKDHGEGLDYYHVGFTLGAGDIAAFLNDSIQFIHNYQTWQILDNGPLRSTFRVQFAPYTYHGITINETRTVSLDAGSQLSRVQVHIDHTSPEKLPMVVGITLRSEESPLLLDEKAGFMGYWEPKHGKDGSDGTMGVGSVFTSRPVSMLKKYEHALTKLQVSAGDDVVYYTGGAWDKAGQITTSDAWFAYLRQYAAQLRTPLRISAGKSGK